MAATSHNPHLHSSNPSTRSYDLSSTTSSATSPKLLARVYGQQQQYQYQYQHQHQHQLQNQQHEGQQNTGTGVRLTAVTPGSQTSIGSMLPSPAPPMQYGVREDQDHQAYRQQSPYAAYSHMAGTAHPPPQQQQQQQQHHLYHHASQPYTAGSSAMPSGSDSAASTPNPRYMPLPPSGGGGGGRGGSGGEAGSMAGGPALSPSMSPAFRQQQHQHHGQSQIKRPYRQRRKDPSCDACRERKVKCDATETTSCSECLNRQVKCQFTKETNRRMSSMKQMQDLERQMERMRRENSELRRRLQQQQQHDSGAFVKTAESVTVKMESQGGGIAADYHHPRGSSSGSMNISSSNSTSLQLPAIGSNPRRRQRQRQHARFSEPSSTMAVNLHQVRLELRVFAKGIWQLPTPTTATITAVPPADLDLPPEAAAEPLLHAYYVLVHPMMPMLHWPTFMQSVDRLYHGSSPSPSPSPSLSSSSTSPPSSASLAVFFAVLAVGSLFCTRPCPDASFGAADLAEAARTLLDPWGGCSTVPTLDDARARLLLAVFLNESHLKSAAWMWLGSAVRVGQDLGLYLESDAGEDGQRAHGQLAAEMRRRVWWTMYILDRSLAVELGRPPLIDDDDCDVELPAAVDDHNIMDGRPGVGVGVGVEPLTHSMLAVLHVVRAYTALGRILRAAPAPAPAVDAESHDRHGGRDRGSSSSNAGFFSPHEEASTTGCRPASSSSLASTPSPTSGGGQRLLLLPSASPSPSSPCAISSTSSASSRGICDADLAAFEQHFAACMRIFPPARQLSSASRYGGGSGGGSNVGGPEAHLFLSPLAPIAYVLHARLLLHRANLAPACAPPVRRAAVEQCTRVALDTAALIDRQAESVRDTSRGGPCTNLLVTHFFRCALFAILTGHVDDAALLVHAISLAATAPAGTSRDSLATPCGRFLAFFASRVSFKRAEHGARTTSGGSGSGSGNGETTNTISSLILDEELLAYASADLQATPEGAWVWGGEEVSHGPVATAITTAQTPLSVAIRGSLSDAESRDWCGWESLEFRVRSLAAATTPGSLGGSSTRSVAAPPPLQPHYQPRHQPRHQPSPASLPTTTPYSSPPYHYTTRTGAPPRTYGNPVSVKVEPHDNNPRAALLGSIGSLRPSARVPVPVPASTLVSAAGKSASQERISIANIS